MPTVSVQGRPEHDALWNGLSDELARHPELGGDEALALVANLLGHMAVATDPEGLCPDMMFEIVNRNFAIGQREAREERARRARH